MERQLTQLAPPLGPQSATRERYARSGIGRNAPFHIVVIHMSAVSVQVCIQPPSAPARATIMFTTIPKGPTTAVDTNREAHNRLGETVT